MKQEETGKGENWKKNTKIRKKLHYTERNRKKQEETVRNNKKQEKTVRNSKKQ